MSPDIKIAIVDDHSIIQEGLELLLSQVYGFNNCFSYYNGNELLEALGTQSFDLIILDVQLPDIMAFSLVPRILKINRKQRILIFSMYPEKILARPLFKLGIKGYLGKQAPRQEMLTAIETVLKGKVYMSEPLKTLFSKKYVKSEENEGEESMEELSSRELEVLLLLLKGEGVLEIGNNLNISPSTVATYKSRVFRKMAVNNVIELYHKGAALGMV